MAKKRYEICHGVGEPVMNEWSTEYLLKNRAYRNSEGTVIINNPVEGDERLDHWSTFFGDDKQTGVKRIWLRCTTCGRKVRASVSVCGDGCCVIFEMPPHKPKGWHKTKNRPKKGNRR